MSNACMNCGAEADYDTLCITYERKLIGLVCKTCLEGVKKPQVTLTRSNASAPFAPQQYLALEVFR